VSNIAEPTCIAGASRRAREKEFLGQQLLSPQNSLWITAEVNCVYVQARCWFAWMRRRARFWRDEATQQRAEWERRHRQQSLERKASTSRPWRLTVQRGADACGMACVQEAQARLRRFFQTWASSENVSQIATRWARLVNMASLQRRL